MISKNYIVNETVLPLSVNAKEEKVNQFVPDAVEKLIEILPSALYADLQTLNEEDVKEWSKTNDYASGNKVIHSENGVLKMWESQSTNSNEEPTTANSANWTELKLGTLLCSYVLPYLAHHVFYSYAVNGSINFSHQGMQKIQNETAAQLSPQERQSVLNYWRDRRDLKKRRMFNYLDEQNNLLDGTTYESVESSKKKSRFSIRPIGRS